LFLWENRKKISIIRFQNTKNIYECDQNLTAQTDTSNENLNLVYGPKRDEVTGECRKLHNEEFNP
jgi:hypothetical protein